MARVKREIPMQQLDLFPIAFDEEVKLQDKPKRKQGSQYAFDLQDVLSSPIITWPSPWQELIPCHVKENITLARMAALLKGEEIATIPEVVAYIMPRSSDAPMSREWSNIYLFVSRSYMITYRGTNPEELDFAQAEIDDYEQRLLISLRRWIYVRRRKALKEKLR